MTSIDTTSFKNVFGHSHVQGTDTSGNSTVTKVICMVVLGVTSFVSGNLPLLLNSFYENKEYNSEAKRRKSEQKKRKIIYVLLAFTGGVLFCTVFLHLLPEVGEVFEDISKEDGYDLPEFFPQALLCIGFFIMYFVEELAHKLMHNNNKNFKIDQSISSNVYQNEDVTHDENISTFINNVINITEQASKNLSFEDRQKIIKCVKNAVASREMNSPHIAISGTSNGNFGESRCNDAQIHELELVTTTRTSVRSFLLFLALSVHALFEGMAIGLEKRSSAVWFMLFGVGSHKILLSVCMGIEMIAGNIKKVTHITYVTMFALISPLGMGIGLFVSNEYDALSAVFQGLASGTLLYVLFYEVLKRNSDGNEKNSIDSGFTTFISILIGFILMTALQILAD